MEIDKLKLYFGEPYKINDKITILQPSIGDIMRFGEKDFYAMLNPFITNPTSYRLTLWDAGIDWNTITDYDLFATLLKSTNPNNTKLLFGDIDFRLFNKYTKKLNDEETTTLYNPEQDIEIDEKTYEHIAKYLRTMFNIFPKVEKAKGKTTKEWMIDEDRISYNLHKDEDYKSTLLPLISSCLNHPGFKYKKSELKDVCIVEFMDSVQRLQIYENTTALMGGMYSGMVDAKGLDKDALNFMRSI